MLGWAGLRGATPIWLATFPVVAGIAGGEEEFAIVFFVVVTSTLVQGASFEPLATRLGLTTDEPALPRRLLESGRIRRMGGDVIAYRLPRGRGRGRAPGARTGAAARGAGQRDRPRRPRDPAARLDRAARGRRAPHPRPRRAARRGRGADRALGQGPDRQTGPAAAAAPRRLAGLLGAPGARGRRPAGAERDRRHPGAGGAAQPPRRRRRDGWRSPTGATR